MRHFLRDDDLTPGRAGPGARPRGRAQARAVRRQAARRPAHGRDDLRQADAAHPGVVRRRHRRARRLPDAGRRRARRHRRARVRARRRPGARPPGVGDRVAHLRPDATSRRWPSTPASRSSTRSPTTSTPASCSPTCSRSGSTSGELAGLTVAFVGDGACNMGNSWLLAGATAGMHVRVSSPDGYAPVAAMVERAAAIAATHRRLRAPRARPGRRRHRRRRRRHRHLDLDGQGGRGRGPRRGLRAVLAHHRALRAGQARRDRACTACRPTAARRSTPR